MILKQTRGGAYNSFPRIEDVKAELSGERDWQRSYADAGHGEYIYNVLDVVEEAKTSGKTPEYILSKAEVVFA